MCIIICLTSPTFPINPRPGMKLLFLKSLSFLVLAPLSTAVQAYENGCLNQYGDPDSVTYQTANTPKPNNTRHLEAPDVYLNASVSVDVISIEVEDITAKVNLDAKVLGLLKFSAGVDASVDRVKLSIDDVSARVLLEVRPGNMATMVDDVLRSIDLNPLVGNGIGDIVDNAASAIGLP